MKKLVLLTTLVVLLLLPTAASAKSVTLSVGSTAVSWRSPETFDADQTVVVHIRFRGKDLVQDIINGCRADYAGYGITARVRTCGDNRPIRIRLASAREKAAKVTIRYFAD